MTEPVQVLIVNQYVAESGSRSAYVNGERVDATPHEVVEVLEAAGVVFEADEVDDYDETVDSHTGAEDIWDDELDW